MALLPENITAGATGHIGHSNQIHKKLNAIWIDVKADYSAAGDGVTDDTSAIQAAIDAAEAAGGGIVFFPEGDYLTSAALVVDDHAVTLLGVGAGFESAGVTDLRTSAGSRIVFSAAATPAPVVRFTSVAGTLPKSGGGCVNMLLDGNGRATRCLEILSWRGGRFDDLTLFAATGEMLFTGCISGTLSNEPYSLQHNTFIRVVTSARNQTTNTAHAARLTGGQGAGATAAGNTSFNTFICCQFRCYNANALVLEDSDNNQFIGCQAGRDIGTTYSLVLSSADQDASGSVLTGRHARFNTFYSCEFNDGVHARASQVGNSSSFGNQFYGLNYSNASPQVTYEAAAGGSAEANARVFSSTAAELLNATDVALADNIANVATARTNLSTESVRIKNGSSDHIRLESGDGLSSWQVSIDNATGNFRILRATGSGGIILSAVGGKVGFYGVTPATRPTALTAPAAAAPAGGVGTAAGGWDTAVNRDAAIATINNLRTRLTELETKLQSLGLIS